MVCIACVLCFYLRLQGLVGALQENPEPKLTFFNVEKETMCDVCMGGGGVACEKSFSLQVHVLYTVMLTFYTVKRVTVECCMGLCVIVHMYL